jgi:hypothetical protein
MSVSMSVCACVSILEATQSLSTVLLVTVTAASRLARYVFWEGALLMLCSARIGVPVQEEEGEDGREEEEDLAWL